MRIARFALPGGEPTFGVVELAEDDGAYPNTVAVVSSDPLAGPVRYTGARHDLDVVRLLAPVIPRSKIVAIGHNWLGHAREMGAPVEEVPTVFYKPNTSVIGPDEPIIKPTECEHLSYEGELAIVIGRICRRVAVDDVGKVIFGYTCANDVTARDLQNSDEQWTRGKGFDTFCPLGPWIVAHLSVAEADARRIVTKLDDEVVQDDTTANMIHSVASIVSFASSFNTLLPGDVILTGTPPLGVGRMAPGQRVSVSIDGIGTLTNPVIDESDER